MAVPLAQTIDVDVCRNYAVMYFCPVCGTLMRDACQTVYCKHHFCEPCLKQLFDEERKTGVPAKCPRIGCDQILHGIDGTKYFPDRSLQRKILKLSTKCPLQKCQWSGEVGMLEDHLCQQHPSFIVKPVESSRATHVLVDKIQLAATQALQQHLEKVTGEAFETAKLLGEAIDTQNNMDNIVRVGPDDNQASAAHSTASLGRAEQPTVQEHSFTLKADSFKSNPAVVGNVEQLEMDTSTLTQVDQAMHPVYGHNQQAQVSEVHPLMLNQRDNNDMTTSPVDLSGASAFTPTAAGSEKPSKRRRRSTNNSESSSILPGIKCGPSVNVNKESGMKGGRSDETTFSGLPLSLPPLVPKKTVSQYTQTTTSDFIPPLPPKLKKRQNSASTTQQRQETPPINPPMDKSTHTTANIDELPPPLPIKRRQGSTSTSQQPPLPHNQPQHLTCLPSTIISVVTTVDEPSYYAMRDLTERQLKEEKEKTASLTNIIRNEFRLTAVVNTSSQDPQDTRKRLFSVPANTFGKTK